MREEPTVRVDWGVRWSTADADVCWMPDERTARRAVTGANGVLVARTVVDTGWQDAE